MRIIEHEKNDIKLAEVISDEIIVSNVEDGSHLLANLYYQGFDVVAIRAEQFHPDFFKLKTGMAGEIMQKCSNWRMRLAIIGNFSQLTSKSLRDLIYESNKGKLVSFAGAMDEVLERV